MLRIGLLGAGRIARTHAVAIADTEGAAVVAVHDVMEQAAQDVAARTGARVASAEEAVTADDVDAVVICSPTDVHAAQIEAAAAAGKAIFCEKPIDLDVARAREAVAAAESAGVPLMIGFNRRFDPNFTAMRRRIAEGDIGAVELLQITSRDPSPPPVSYIERSGGLFRDMTIHDFDMARFLLGSDIVEVSATGAVRVDPAIGEAGDIDTATIILTAENGALAVITNSRRASYGYDQRAEAHGPGGMILVDNPRANAITHVGASGFTADPLMDFFMERYAASYRLEMEAFVKAVSTGVAPSPSGADGVKALEIADAAKRAMDTGARVRVG